MGMMRPRAWVFVEGSSVGLPCAAVAVLAAGLLGGCVKRDMRAVTSGEIGCQASDITISDDNPELYVSTWKAECHGRHYFCSAHGRGGYSTDQVSCKEDADEPAASRQPIAVQATPVPDRDDIRVCEAASAHAADFGTYWATRSANSRPLDEPAQPRDFVVVCRAMPENVQRCMHTGYLAAHAQACEAVLLRLDPVQRSKVDGLFLQAEVASPK
jgi:hypothetical protein